MKSQNLVDVDPKKLLQDAQRQLDKGRADEALRATAQILQRDPDHLGALEVQVRAQWRIGDLAGALRSLRRLTLLNPYEPGYYLMQGDILSLMGQPLQARKAFERCLAFEGSRAKADALSQIALIDSQCKLSMPGTGAWIGDDLSEVVYAAEAPASTLGYLASRPS